jgi:predicted extracellular nuclease
LKFVSNYEPIAVEKNTTRPGAIFSLKSGNFDAYLMLVHFKSTSRYDSTEYLEEKSRKLRTEQAKVLNNWIDSMLNFSGEKDIFVLGDFNDYPSRKNNPTLTSLLDNKNIEFLTFDMKSCKFEYLGSIDHIVITNNIKNRYLANSLRMYDINSAFTDAEVENISDHCPVLATFNIQLKDDD